MDAGCELDALVAEKVMGWVRVGADWHIKPHHRPSLDRPGEVFDEWDAKGPHDFLIPPGAGIHHRQGVSFCGCEYDGEIPPYSTSIQAAWQVVEKMEKDGMPLALQSPGSVDISECYYEFNKWTAHFGSKLGSDRAANAAPFAICLAALAAVGAEA